MWFPKSQNAKISSMIYNFLNENQCASHIWFGWLKIQTLKVAPLAKHFLWLLFKGRISTYEFLYYLKLGPLNSCAMCGLDYESIDHLMVSCAYAQMVWNLISTHTGGTLNFQNRFGFGDWLISNNYSLYIKSVVAAASWFLWKVLMEGSL